jgi:S1-C subfamily serine protease
MRPSPTLTLAAAVVLGAGLCELGHALLRVPEARAAAPAPTVGPPPGPQPLPPPPPDDLMPEEKRDIEIFRRASASVVYITTSAVQRDLFSLDTYEVPQGTGSGFVWDTAGHIVTNFHVVQGGDAFEVTLADHTTVAAQLIGAAPDKDLAVLQIKAAPERLVPLEPGRSHDLLVGQRVLAVGNPFGLDHSLTAGMVSALGRELKSPGGRTIHDVIQTDAAINPGNSGGPLLDSRGKLVGVNSAIYSPSGAFAGIGFAIPIDTVRHLVPQLIKSGQPVEPGIGVSLLPDAYAERLGLRGAVIYEVARGSVAARAGIQGIHRGRLGGLELGDRVVAVNGAPVRTGEALLDAFEAAGVGQTVVLTLARNGGTREVKVTLTEE